MKDILLVGDPIKVDWLYVYPWKIRDIVKDQQAYYQSLFIYFLKKEDLQFPEEFAELVENYSVFDLIDRKSVV